MSKKILAFGASSSTTSINKKLASFAANQLDNATTTLLDLNDFEMPIYSIDREKQNGIPQLAQNFKQHIKEADGIIISFAEHNGAYTAAFKNIMDWVSRIDKAVWDNKPMLLLASSPGGRGGQRVLDIAVNSFPFMGARSISSFALPSFFDNLSEDGIKDSELSSAFEIQLHAFSKALKEDLIVENS